MPAKKKHSTKTADAYFETFQAQHPKPRDRWINSLFALIVLWGFSGLIWFLPFPHLDFLGKYNGFVNWFTFFMAGLVYYYFRMLPIFSYFMLFTFGIFSYLFVQMEYWEQAGGPVPWHFCLCVLLFGSLALFFIRKNALKNTSLFDAVFIATLWPWHVLLKKLNIRY